jgi:hypothetical protein
MPFAGKTDMQILKLISQGMRPPRRDEPPLNNETWELIQRCWAQDALERPGMGNAVAWIIAIPTQSSTDSAPPSPLYYWSETQSLRLENEHENDSESLSFVVPMDPRRSASAPTPPPYQAIQIPNVYHMTSLLPMISRRPSQTWLRDSSAYIPPESHLVPPQPLDQPGQSGALLANLKRPLSPGPDDSPDAKRRRMDLMKQRLVSSPTGRRTSPPPFRAQPASPSPEAGKLRYFAMT